MNAPPATASRGAVLRGVGALGVGTIAAALLGVGLQALIGFHFGASLGTDAYFMSLSIVAFLAKAFMLGHFKAIGLPEYLRLKDTDPEQARRLLGSLLRWGGLGLSGICLVIFVLAPYLVDALAPGYDGEQRNLTIRLLRIRTPALFFLATTAVGLIALETRSRFGLSVALEKVVPAFVTVALLAAVGPAYGLEGLGWMGLAGASAGGLMMLYVGLRAGGMSGGDPKTLKRIGRSWAKFGWSNAATSLAEWVYRVAASLLGPGLFSAVVYGRMVQDMLHGALNDAARTVALPQFARAADDRDEALALTASLGIALEALTAVTLPVAVLVACTAPWITAALFGRGAFLNSGMLGPTAVAMALFMVGFVVQGRNQLCFQVAFAAGQSHIVNRVQVIGHLYRAVALVPMVLAWSFAGLVVAQVTMNLVVACSFWFVAPDTWAEGKHRLTGGLFKGTLRVLPVAAVPAVALLVSQSFVRDPMTYSTVGRLGVLVMLGLGWGVLTLLLARATRLPILRFFAPSR